MIVAEGVETIGELRALHSLGVPFAQGFLLGRPAPLPAHAPVEEPAQQDDGVAEEAIDLGNVRRSRVALRSHPSARGTS